MDLKAISSTFGDFYVPAFLIKVGSKDLIRDLYLTVTSLEIDFKEKAAGRFSVSIANSFDWETREFVARRGEERVNLIDLFAFGSQIEAAIGYGDPGGLEPTFSGIVTEIATSFSEGGTPELTISGYDDLYPLTIGKSTRHWEESRDSDAVITIAQENGLSTSIAQTTPQKRRIDQNEQNDLNFIDKLAKRNGATFYLRDGKLYFGPRQNDRSARIELKWGEGLLSFSPQANLAKQITEVKVHGWSAREGKPILGKAKRGDESGRDSQRKSGAERLAAAFGKAPIMSIRAPVHTQAEADARAKAILEDRAQDFVTGDGECIGLPDIVPDINIALGGLGKGFNKPYYVSEAKHTIGSSGYRTTFKVQETTV